MRHDLYVTVIDIVNENDNNILHMHISLAICFEVKSYEAELLSLVYSDPDL